MYATANRTILPKGLIMALSSWLALPAVQADDLQPEYGISQTFSIVAVDPETGVTGAAVASKYPSVGKVVPYVRAGVGAFCTQHWHHPPWGEKALDLLGEGPALEDDGWAHDLLESRSVTIYSGTTEILDTIIH